MKTKNILLIVFALIFSFGCDRTDFDEILRNQEDQEARIALLEQWKVTVDENITTLQRLVTALQDNDYVTGVSSFTTPSPGGYKITFTKSDEATIWNGAQGETGPNGLNAPVIGVDQYPAESGVYYWTLGDEFIEAGGSKIPVTGVGADGRTPKIIIGTDNLWYISADGSATGTAPGTGWVSTGVLATGPAGTNGDAIFAKDGIDYTTDPDYVTFTLADGTTTITLPMASVVKVAFDSYDIFYASGVNNEIEIVLPATLKEADYSSIMAVVTNGSGSGMDIQTRAAQQNTWEVKVTKPTFLDGALVAGSAKVTLTAPANTKLSETAWLKVTITDNNGQEVSASRPVKYFDGTIVESTAGNLSAVATDASVVNLAVVGSINSADFTYIKSTLASLETLDISMTDLTVVPNDALRFTIEDPNTKIKRVVLPVTATEIGSLSFAYCAALKEINLENVAIIGRRAFRNCSSLEELTFGNKLTDLSAESIFMLCTALTEVEIPGSVETIGKWMFEGCDNLATIKLRPGLRTLSASTFYGCGITSITIPSTVTAIPDFAFEECKNLERVNLHDGITSIGEAAFLRCGMLKQIKIPAGVTIIAYNTFDECGNLQFVEFHDGITEIQERAFAYCRKLQGDNMLENLTLPTGLQTLGNGAFFNCESVKRITMPSVQTIDAYAFQGCAGLLQVDMPANLTSIGDYAFHQCDKLAAVACRAATAPTITSNTFDLSSKANRTLTKPSTANYDSWAGYFNKVYSLP